MKVEEGYFIAEAESITEVNTEVEQIEVTVERCRGIANVLSILLFSDPEDVDIGSIKEVKFEGNNVSFLLVGISSPCIIRSKVIVLGY